MLRVAPRANRMRVVASATLQQRSRHRVARKRDGEHAAGSRQVADAQRATIGPDALARERKSEAQARLVVAALGKGREHLLGASRRKTAALILNLDQDQVAEGMDAQGHLGVRASELEGVL